jgi:hypothetical protein
MTFSSRARTIALAGMLAASGCAGVQQVPTAKPAASQDALSGMKPSETPLQKCQKRRSGVQNCMVETISKQCKAGSKDDDAFYSCVSSGLRMPETAEDKDYKVTVSQGDEVFGLRNPTATVTEVARLDATTIDAKGVKFDFTIERIATSEPTVPIPVSHASMRMEFDGSRSGQWEMVSVVEVVVKSVESAPGGKATVTFETANPLVQAK